MRLLKSIPILLAALLAFALNIQSATTKRPNIVFILADDLGWADLACYGNKFNESPNIDRLAKQGMRFTQFYAAAPVCSPTRASIMAGQYQERFGLTVHIPGHWRPFEKMVEPPNALHLPLEVVTIGERMKQAGYATGYFGKWHLGEQGYGPEDQGFEEVFEFSKHSVPAAQQKPPGKTARRGCDYLAEKAEQFIAAHKQGPFYLQVCPFAVHLPLQTTPELVAKYSAKPKVKGYPCNPNYAGLLEELDTLVGRVMKALDEQGLADNTLLVFSSDNGGLEKDHNNVAGTSNFPLRNEKGSLYEGGNRVPCIVRWPGRTPVGTVSSAMGMSIDFHPTFAAVAGVKLTPEMALDGIDFSASFTDPNRHPARDTLFWHFPHYHHSRPSGAIRSGKWKLIEFFDTGELELYDLSKDLSETRDLHSEEPQVAAELRARLKAWRHEVDAQMPQLNPAYDPARAGEWWNRKTIQPTTAPGLGKGRKKKSAEE